MNITLSLWNNWYHFILFEFCFRCFPNKKLADVNVICTQSYTDAIQLLLKNISAPNTFSAPEMGLEWEPAEIPTAELNQSYMYISGHLNGFSSIIPNCIRKQQY